MRLNVETSLLDEQVVGGKRDIGEKVVIYSLLGLKGKDMCLEDPR